MMCFTVFGPICIPSVPPTSPPHPTCPSPAPPLPIQGMLDYLEKLTMPQIRKLYSIISSLAQDEDSALWVGWMGTQALVCLRMHVNACE